VRHAIVDLAVAAASAAAALLFGVPTIAAIAAGALVGTLALGRERSPSRETPMG